MYAILWAANTHGAKKTVRNLTDRNKLGVLQKDIQKLSLLRMQSKITLKIIFADTWPGKFVTILVIP